MAEGKKLYYGGYGHHPSGKQYVYLGDNKYRVGQNVVVPVRQWKTGKLYNTMFTIQRSANVESEPAIDEMQRVTGSGTSIKFIEGSNVMTLPGASDWKNAKQWKEWSNLLYEEKIANRLKENSGRVVTQISNRELEELKIEKPQLPRKPKKKKEEIKLPTISSNYSGSYTATPYKELKVPSKNSNLKNAGGTIEINTTQSYEGLNKTEKVKAQLKGYSNKKTTNEQVKNRLLSY